MGLLQQAPANPASEGPFRIIFFKDFFCFFVSFGFLPPGFPDLSPEGPFNSSFFIHIRIASSLTCNMDAITEYLCPSITARTPIIRFTVLKSPANLAFSIIFSSCLTVCFVIVIRIFTEILLIIEFFRIITEYKFLS